TGLLYHSTFGSSVPPPSVRQFHLLTAELLASAIHDMQRSSRASRCLLRRQGANEGIFFCTPGAETWTPPIGAAAIRQFESTTALPNRLYSAPSLLSNFTRRQRNEAAHLHR